MSVPISASVEFISVFRRRDLCVSKKYWCFLLEYRDTFHYLNFQYFLLLLFLVLLLHCCFRQPLSWQVWHIKVPTYLCAYKPNYSCTYIKVYPTTYKTARNHFFFKHQFVLINRGLTEENTQLGISNPQLVIFFQLRIGDLFSDSALSDSYIYELWKWFLEKQPLCM